MDDLLAFLILMFGAAVLVTLGLALFHLFLLALLILFLILLPGIIRGLFARGL
jgi:hypothetical protein